MKKYICLLLVMTMVITLSGCNSHFFSGEVTDFEELSPVTSEYGILSYLMPVNIKNYKFFYYGTPIEKNGYWRWKDIPFGDTEEIMLAYLKYDSSEYDDAKKFVFENMDLNPNIWYSNDNYCFYSNNRTISEKEISNKKATSSLSFFGYNDTTNTLVFFGSFFTGEIYYEKGHLIFDDFNAYLDLFSDYYNFDE